MKYEDYPTELKDVPVGRRFCMLNYGPIHMKVELSYGINVIDASHHGHSPIIDLETGRVSLMSNIKPCRIWGG